MSFSIHTHDAWGVVPIRTFTSLEEARAAFAAVCEDPWYRQDGTVKGVELVELSQEGVAARLAWFPFREG